MYCQTCDYNITISIMGENKSYSFSRFLASQECSAGSQKWDTSFTLPLEYGVWTITRKIETNNADEEDQDKPDYAKTSKINTLSEEIAGLLEERGQEEISGLIQNIRSKGVTALSDAASAFSLGNTLFANLSNTSTNASVKSILAESFSSKTTQMLNEISASPDLSALFQNHSSEEDNSSFTSIVEIFQSTLTQSLADRIEATQEKLEESYTEHCLDYSEIQDVLSYQYSKGSYHYTLFYYDRAGNLVRTVQPSGVDLSSTSRMDHPTHTFETEYDYNFLGQTVRKKTTDGGEIIYYYDDEKRIRFSKNEKQLNNHTYSYIKYDDLGRIIEAGESDEDYANLESNVNSSIFPGTGNNRTFSVYTQACPYLPATASQNYLRNRISYVHHDNESYIAYSYDPHGNVKTLYTFVPGLCLSKNDVKITDYEYDLISNQVKKISYNQGNIDQFFYAFSYDANGRVTAVKTSTDGKIYDSDARYRYFKHGPLKRMEIGEDDIQGVDYVYTLQGLLKAINHASLDKNLDPGKDNLSNNFAADAFATMLAYYTDDYYKSGSQYNTNSSNANCLVPTATSSLYNGMITSEISKTIDSPLTQNLSCKNAWGYSYKYDELYRLKGANTFASNGTNFAPTENYKMQISYDANGNITTLQRNGYVNTTTGAQLKMDELTYNYTASTNKLSYVTDAVTATNYNVDIDDQTANNYEYDKLGNLTKDVAEDISSITWNVQNKPETVTKTTGETLTFEYDPMGNRIIKKMITKDAQLTTYYVRDAKGSLLAIYKEESTTTSGATEKVLTLDEIPLKQLGSYKPEVWVRRIENAGSSSEVLTKNTLSTSSAYSRELGKKQYQINDHLGNVRLSFTDIKLSDLNATTNAPQNFRAEINSINNYYAYGMLMVGNTYNTSNTTFGYQGKEKDSEFFGEGCAYDFGARIYDPRLGRWMSRDPLADKTHSVYDGMGNNPVNMVDPDGRAPGDVFKSADAAARDFGMFYNKRSISEKQEYGSTIYQVTDVTTGAVIGFSYSAAAVGGTASVLPSPAPPGSVAIAFAHTHGHYTGNRRFLQVYDDNRFSGPTGDIGYANMLGIDGYVVTPNGSLQKYDVATGTITKIATNMPNDPSDPTSPKPKSKDNWVHGEGSFNPRKPEGTLADYSGEIGSDIARQREETNYQPLRSQDIENDRGSAVERYREWEEEYYTQRINEGMNDDSSYKWEVDDTNDYEWE
jgi:RHS repeat-associated protein